MPVSQRPCSFLDLGMHLRPCIGKIGQVAINSLAAVNMHAVNLYDDTFREFIGGACSIMVCGSCRGIMYCLMP